MSKLPFILILLFACSQQVDGQQIETIELGEPVSILGDESRGSILTMPFDLVAGNGDTLYVLDNRDQVVVAFDLEGNELFRFGGEGAGPGEFISPNALTYADNKIFVTDTNLLRVSEFNSKGSFHRSFSIRSFPTSVIVYENVAYVGTRSRSTLVWKIPLDETNNRTPILTYDHPYLKDVENRFRSTSPLMTIVENNLIVSLPNTGQLAIADLTERDIEFTVSDLRISLIDEYFREFQRLLLIQEKDPFPGNSLPSAFISISSWPEGKILLEIRRGRAQTYDPIGIVIDYKTLEEVGPRFVSRDKTYICLKFLNNINKIGWINWEKSIVDIFSY